MITAATVSTIQGAMGAMSGVTILAVLIAFREARAWRGESSAGLSLAISLAALLFILFAATEMLATWSPVESAQDPVQRLFLFIASIPFVIGVGIGGVGAFALARQKGPVAEASEAE
jgi:hypothetical protein